MIKNFEGLDVWKKAHLLVLEIYRITTDFPPEEKYGIVSQIRRAAISVPANIAEGFRKYGTKDKVRFYNIAQGSLDELYYYLILSKDLRYISNIDVLQDKIHEVARMLFGLIKSINNNINTLI